MNVSPGHKGFVSRPISDRFWEKVQIADEDSCWLWNGSRVDRGYGRIWHNGRHRPAHRVAWELHHDQPFPEGMDALHRCDNPSCVNPRHIFPGTPSDNAKDAIAKGHWWWKPRAETCGQGHPMVGDNLYHHKGGTDCRQCRIDRNREYRRRAALARPREQHKDST